jgi:hypothetical protein
LWGRSGIGIGKTKTTEYTKVGIIGRTKEKGEIRGIVVVSFGWSNI